MLKEGNEEEAVNRDELWAYQDGDVKSKRVKDNRKVLGSTMCKNLKPPGNNGNLYN